MHYLNLNLYKILDRPRAKGENETICISGNTTGYHFLTSQNDGLFQSAVLSRRELYVPI